MHTLTYTHKSHTYIHAYHSLFNWINILHHLPPIQVSLTCIHTHIPIYCTYIHAYTSLTYMHTCKYILDVSPESVRNTSSMYHECIRIWSTVNTFFMYHVNTFTTNLNLSKILLNALTMDRECIITWTNVKVFLIR